MIRRLFQYGLPLLLTGSLGVALPAQQLPLFSLYRENQGLLNPASANSDFLLYQESYRLSVGVTHRSQWIGEAGKATTQSLRGEYIAVGESGFAPLAGLYLLNDRVGPTSFTGLYGRIASIFGIEHPNFGGFSAGINAGLVQYRVDVSKIDLLDPDDLLGQSDQSRWHPDVGLGVFGYKNIEINGLESALVYAGFSATQLIGLDLTFKGDDHEFPFTRRPHFYALAGVYKFLDAFSFVELSTWIRHVRHVPLDVDVNLRYQKRQKFWVGGGASFSGSLHAEFGVFLLQALERGRPGGKPLLKLSTGFDYALFQDANLTDRAFELNLAVIPRWGR